MAKELISADQKLKEAGDVVSLRRAGVHIAENRRAVHHLQYDEAILLLLCGALSECIAPCALDVNILLAKCTFLTAAL